MRQSKVILFKRFRPKLSIAAFAESKPVNFPALFESNAVFSASLFCTAMRGIGRSMMDAPPDLKTRPSLSRMEH